MDKISGNLICASLFTGAYDVNRNEMLPNDDFRIIEKWCQSIQNLGLKGLVFHNHFTEKTLSSANPDFIQFIKVDFEGPLSANAFRYLVYADFLKKHHTQIKNIFFTDIADVEVVKNPFEDPFYTENPKSIFCGDEEETLYNPWMKAHSTHLRNQIPDFIPYEQANSHQQLLNCGIIGGKISHILPLMEQLSYIHRTYTITNQTPYTLDMGAFNYVMRTAFGNQIKHGPPVNTRFKGYESARTDCWFRHK